ncbi:metal ABC transporter ATP-binding protein [Nesterenkonia sandarakina]|uniref:Manganese transport system ATP-binding protein n=1 Tax=Nesterenkonia sandarakina TaxID=272918 RepID=A0A2T0YHM3_9MICC|nr:metal ABC transporter ATP-binding protein [Nesterenkonia sandarakina]PRZ14555.1 manganese transport system ATP-binding protein [Nesterenkonia sandarakina]
MSTETSPHTHPDTTPRAGSETSADTGVGSGATPGAAVVVERLSAGYPGVRALDEVSITVGAGRICALLGANGSGKSTLFKALLGLHRPTAGTVRLFGMDPSRARRRNQVSYVPQHEQVDTSFPVSVEQVVMMGRYGHMGLTKRARPSDRLACDEALDQVGLSELRRRGIGELSGGQRKRAFLARAIAQQAPLMLLDEPFAGVDRGSEELISSVLKALRDTSGTTVLISTHHLAGVEDLADEVVLLHQRVLAAGLPSEVLTEEQLGRSFGAVLRETT